MYIYDRWTFEACIMQFSAFHCCPKQKYGTFSKGATSMPLLFYKLKFSFFKKGFSKFQKCCNFGTRVIFLESQHLKIFQLVSKLLEWSEKVQLFDLQKPLEKNKFQVTPRHSRIINI